MNLMENMGLVAKTDSKEIELISINRLHENPDNFYGMDEGIEELKQSILLAGGVRQNLIVKPDEDLPGEYIVVAGHRRLKACKELIEAGETIESKLPCIVEKDIDIADMLLITTNSTTRKLSDWERIVLS